MKHSSFLCVTYVFIVLNSVTSLQAQWTKSSGLPNGPVKSIATLNTTDYAVVNGSLYESLDNGTTWSQIPNSTIDAYNAKLDNAFTVNMVYVNDGNVYVGTSIALDMYDGTLDTWSDLTGESWNFGNENVNPLIASGSTVYRMYRNFRRHDIFRVIGFGPGLATI